jgi:putative transposase
MGIARSTLYDLPTAVHDDTAIVEAIAAICDEFEFYGWRRVRADGWSARPRRRYAIKP